MKNSQVQVLDYLRARLLERAEDVEHALLCPGGDARETALAAIGVCGWTENEFLEAWDLASRLEYTHGW
jgi:lipopolysaccharide biosynthesis regulator YciM